VTSRRQDAENVEPLMYATPWFMTLFTTTLPWATVLRIWDMFYCEGCRVLLQIALAIMTLHAGAPRPRARLPLPVP
jgi:hypothetical protein